MMETGKEHLGHGTVPSVTSNRIIKIRASRAAVKMWPSFRDFMLVNIVCFHPFDEYNLHKIFMYTLLINENWWDDNWHLILNSKYCLPANSVRKRVAIYSQFHQEQLVYCQNDILLLSVGSISLKKKPHLLFEYFTLADYFHLA